MLAARMSSKSAPCIHVVPFFEGRLGSRTERRLTCFRCRRDLPESQFRQTGMSRKVDWGDIPKYIYYDGICALCRKQMTVAYADHPLVTPAVHRHMDRLCKAAHAGHRKRRIGYSLNVSDLLFLWVQQEGRCNLTGEKMEYGGARIKARSAASLDRIDPTGSYTPDNVQLVCWAVNCMRNNMQVDEFGFWCQRVLLHALGKQQPANG